LGILKQFLRRSQSETDFTIAPHHDGTPNAFVISTKDGHVNYVHKPEDDTNEIWWIESNRAGHGSELVDLMQKNHPAGNIAWGVTSSSGEALADKWHRNHPDVYKIEGPHENQFDPFG
jgi:hypothetical protein